METAIIILLSTVCVLLEIALYKRNKMAKHYRAKFFANRMRVHVLEALLFFDGGDSSKGRVDYDECERVSEETRED